DYYCCSYRTSSTYIF
nr:immunoglobulin light chain junction region [Macaca mulatta]MOW17502.1 immunoglobulin light chain junction region [Macaca mulatta]MOW17890.1 immunoglobulin light chain junction region [Macaca mulatta]